MLRATCCVHSHLLHSKSGLHSEFAPHGRSQVGKQNFSREDECHGATPRTLGVAMDLMSPMENIVLVVILYFIGFLSPAAHWRCSPVLFSMVCHPGVNPKAKHEPSWLYLSWFCFCQPASRQSSVLHRSLPTIYYYRSDCPRKTSGLFPNSPIHRSGIYCEQNGSYSVLSSDPALLIR